MTDDIITTYVEGQFCGIHTEPYAHVTHGHDFWVRSTWEQRGDFRLLRDLFDDELSALDHRDLNSLFGNNATNETLAAYLGSVLGSSEVEVWRFDRGRRFGAIWRKAKS